MITKMAIPKNFLSIGYFFLPLNIEILDNKLNIAPYGQRNWHHGRKMTRDVPIRITKKLMETGVTKRPKSAPKGSMPQRIGFRKINKARMIRIRMKYLNLG